MRNVCLTRISIVLLAVLCWSFTGINSNEFSKALLSEEVTDFSSVDNGQSVSNPEGVVMPRMGQSYYGSITYHGQEFPISIFWDPDIEYYNLYAYIGGVVNPFIPGNVYRYTLQHVATYDSESTIQRFWFVIKCNFIIEYGPEPFLGNSDEMHVSFLVTFDPQTYNMTCDVIEEGYGVWGDPDLE